MWQGLHWQKLQFDVVILDHSYGPGFSGDAPSFASVQQFSNQIQQISILLNYENIN